MADEQDMTAAEVAEIERPSFRERMAARIVGSSAEVIPADDFDIMEAQLQEKRILEKDLDLLAWSALDYIGGNEQDMVAVERRKLVQRSRIAWQQDPQVGASTELMNTFALGKGIPRPKARDEKVQQVLDEAWDDDDNKLVLTEYAAQLSFNTDLTLQSNVYILVFAADDGKVKLAVLDHDTVENVVRDPENRRRILWYVAKRKLIKWDFESDGPRAVTEKDPEGKEKLLYFKDWKNEPPDGMDKPAASKIGKGEVYHVAINRTGEMAFGHPSMHRMLRWATAFNSLMEARVDLARAAAAFIMKRKVKGTPAQVRKLAEQQLSRRSQLGRSLPADEDSGELQGPRAGSILSENEGVDHESFSLDSQANNANLDAQMIRSQISSGSPGMWPQHYLGDIGSSTLATASAMELVPMKAVESRQEVIESVCRWFNDLVIEKAIKSGRLKKELTPQELAAKKVDEKQEGTDEAPPTPSVEDETSGPQKPITEGVQEGAAEVEGGLDLGEPAVDDAAQDDDNERMRDLSYDFSLPSPVRKVLAELVTACQTIAQTFDPNNSNVELSRTLLAVVLGEALEVADPGEIVEKVFPPGYKDPALEMLKNLPPGLGGKPGAPGAPPKPGEPGFDPNNPYSVKQNGSAPDGGENPYGNTMEALAEALTELLEAKQRDGDTSVGEKLMERLDPATRKRLLAHMEDSGDRFDAAAAEVRKLTGGDDGA